MTTLEAMSRSVEEMRSAIKRSQESDGARQRRLNRIALGTTRLRSLRPSLSWDEAEALATAVVDSMGWEDES